MTFAACPDCGGPWWRNASTGSRRPTSLPSGAPPGDAIPGGGLSLPCCVANRSAGSIRTWRRINMGPPPTVWAIQRWLRPMGCTMGSASPCAKSPSWRSSPAYADPGGHHAGCPAARSGPVGVAYEVADDSPGEPLWCIRMTRVGGSEASPAYLMAFDTDAATVYQIRSQHRHEEVQEVIPPTMRG